MSGLWANTIAIWIVVAILSILSAFFVPKIRGTLGEGSVKRLLSRLPEESYRVLNDIMVNGKYGLTQIDHVVVSKYGIFVIETKNMKGKIYGGERSGEWTKYSKGRKLTFKNPTHQNYGHVKTLEQLTALSPGIFHGVVVFVGSARLQFDAGRYVVYENELLDLIRSYQMEVLSSLQMDHITEVILSANNNTSVTRKEHLTQIRSKAAEKDEKVKNMICPKCGGELRIRKGRYGQFYGCSNYPTCRFTKNI